MLKIIENNMKKTPKKHFLTLKYLYIVIKKIII